MFTLSKSTFLRGLHCKKSLWLHLNKSELKKDPEPNRSLLFLSGHRVGQLGRNLYEGGIDCSDGGKRSIQDNLIITQQFIKEGRKILYEAAFVHDDVLVIADILICKGDFWTMIEVKGGTNVKQHYLTDAALQYYIITASGLKIKEVQILCVNSSYKLKKELSLQNYFKSFSVLTRVKKLQSEIKAHLSELKKVIQEKTEPHEVIDGKCKSPFTCEFHEYCWKNIPEHSVFEISGIRREKSVEWFKRGIKHQEDVLHEFEKGSKAWIQINSVKQNQVHILKDELTGFINSLKYPLRFLDFETVMPAVPIYEGTQPYQQIAFQYSMHMLNRKDAMLEHFGFLADEQAGDPREKFLLSLIKDCGSEGDILVYNLSFEAMILRSLMKDFPQHESTVKNILSRLKDLMIPFQKSWFYHPKMKGSHSIKAVLPALAPHLSYEDLEIKDGGIASAIFFELMNGTFKGDKIATRRNLELYCERDTYGMVILLQELQNRC